MFASCKLFRLFAKQKLFGKLFGTPPRKVFASCKLFSIARGGICEIYDIYRKLTCERFFSDSMQAVAEITAERRKRFKRRMGDGGLVYPRV